MEGRWLEQAEGEMLGEEGRGEEGRVSRSGRKNEKDYFQHAWGCVCVCGPVKVRTEAEDIELSDN